MNSCRRWCTSPAPRARDRRWRSCAPASRRRATGFMPISRRISCAFTSASAWRVELLEECERVNRDAPITYFEITTAAAFLAFTRVPADIVLLEVGVGGRLDATNVVRRPAVTAITPVSLDHQALLGDTVAAI